MSPVWPVAMLVALLGHVWADLAVPAAEAIDYSECNQCSKGGRQYEIQSSPRPPRTLIQVQLGTHFENAVELQVRNQNKFNAAGPHLETNRMASRVQPSAKVQHRHTAGIEIGPHSETDSTTLRLHTRANVPHLPAASIELRTKSTSTGLKVTPKSYQQHGPTAKAGTNSTSTGLNITPKTRQQYGGRARAGNQSMSTELNITPKSHQQDGPTAKAGIGAAQWLQMLYVKSTRVALVNRPVEAMQYFMLWIKYLLAVLFLGCLPMMVLMAYLEDVGISTDSYRFWRRHRGRQGPSPQVDLSSRTDHHRYLGSPSNKSAAPTPDYRGPSSSFPQQQKQHQQQQQQQHKHQYLPILPPQSRDQSREHKVSCPSSPAEVVSQGPCLCPELLVPEGKECCLLLPLVITKDIRPPRRFTILSPDGAAVFSLTLGNSGCTDSHGKRLLTLHSAVSEGVVFASCNAVVSDQGEPEKVAISDRDGKHFADIQTCGKDKSAMLTPHSGPSATIRCDDRRAGRIQMTDSDGWLLAVADVVDDSVQAVRIGAKVDAGLITITMLSFNLLEPEHEVDS